MEYKSHWKDTEEHPSMYVALGGWVLTNKNNLKKFMKVTYSMIKIIVHV